uniref:Uncharacterized protein n=1 Tax=Romanomermis culicivorax TaxID=13658 RepID=A0A915K9S3_ROMCU
MREKNSKCQIIKSQNRAGYRKSQVRNANFTNTTSFKIQFFNDSLCFSIVLGYIVTVLRHIIRPKTNVEESIKTCYVWHPVDGKSPWEIAMQIEKMDDQWCRHLHRSGDPKKDQNVMI